MLTILTFSLILWVVSIFAGLLGSLTGLGGGIIITPILVLFFHINIHYAMGASLISVMATSTGTSIAYLRDGYTNLRIGLLLETSAVIGAFVGALLVPFVPLNIIAFIFGITSIMTAYLTWHKSKSHQLDLPSHPWASALKLEGYHPTQTRNTTYSVHNVPAALGIMGIAGGLAGLLGIGAGVLKVLAMDRTMQLPYKVATATSNFIIGITAAVSAGVYFAHGYISPELTFPIVIGVIIGATTGSRLLAKIHNQTLRIIFSSLILIMAMQMMYKAILGNF